MWSPMGLAYIIWFTFKTTCVTVHADTTYINTSPLSTVRQSFIREDYRPDLPLVRACLNLDYNTQYTNVCSIKWWAEEIIVPPGLICKVRSTRTYVWSCHVLPIATSREDSHFDSSSCHSTMLTRWHVHSTKNDEERLLSWPNLQWQLMS
jgi:hypothetical protein